MTDQHSDVRVGIIGAGGIFPVHADAWRSLGVETVVFSSDGKQHDAAARFGARGVDTLDELLDAVDVVDICTPTLSHPDLVEQAVAASKHVVCEKPLAITSAEAERLAEVCATAGVQLHIAHVVRYFAEYAAAQQAVASGQLGELAVQRFSRGSSRPTRGWFADPKQSGGILMDQMIHDIDFARWTAGEVVEVFARQTGRMDDQTDTIAAHCLLTHASGAISQCSGLWGHRGYPFQTSFSIAGSDGQLQHDSTQHQPLKVDAAPLAEGSVIPATPFVESPYLTEIAEFHQAILGGPTPRVTPQDAIAAVRLAEAAAQSMASGQPVRIESATSTRSHA
ncbi:Gfo/Idh/MocA family protein [Propionibacteriaceae bacterium Y1685]